MAATSPTPAGTRWLWTSGILTILLVIGTAGVVGGQAPTVEPVPATAGSPEATASQAIDLRPQFTAGRTSRYHIWSRRDIATTMRAGANTRQYESSLEIEGQMTWRVERVNHDGSATCVMSYDWITAVVTPPDGKAQRADSRQTRGEPAGLHELLRALAGQPLRIEVTADGSAHKVSGGDAVRRRLSDPELAPHDLDYLETASELATLPGAPPALDPGRGWDMNHTWRHELGDLHESVRHRLEGVEAIADIPIATVSSVSRLRLDPDMSKFPEGGPRIEVRMMRGESQGQVLFDLARHETVGRNGRTARRVEIRIHLPQQTITRQIDEEIRGQVLRIAEE